LATAFDAGVDVKAIMQALGRTKFSVEARLVKLGKVSARDGTVPFRTRAVL